MFTLDQIPTMRSSATMAGDILLQVCDQSLFGEAVRLVGEEDAEKKGVPLCQHVVMRTTLKNGDPGIIESWFWVMERPMDKALHSGATYIVLRIPKAHTAPFIVDQIVAAARKHLGRMYGYMNLIRVGLGLLGIELPAHEGEPYEICSEFIGEACEAGGYPLEAEDNDANLKPWDLMCMPICPYKLTVIGKFSVPA